MLRGWLSLFVVAGCGRIGFVDSADAGAVDATRTDASPGALAYVTSVAAGDILGAATAAFPFAAAAAGDLVLVQVTCAGTTASDVAFTVPGWTFMEVTPIFGGPAVGIVARSYAATAPSADPATATVAWTGSSCEMGNTILGDEFANGPVAGATVLTSVITTSGTGDCSSSVATPAANSAIWAACVTSTQILGVSAGYTKGSDNGAVDWSVYKVTTDPAGSVETPLLTTGGGRYVMTTVAVPPR